MVEWNCRQYLFFQIERIEMLFNIPRSMQYTYNLNATGNDCVRDSAKSSITIGLLRIIGISLFYTVDLPVFLPLAARLTSSASQVVASPLSKPV